MPTEAISALPTATTANAVDLVLVNQGGVTKTVPASAIAALASGGSGGATTLAALTDVAESSPVAGQVLTYNATTSKWVNATLTGGGSTTLLPVRRQGAFGDIVNGTVTATLPAPALAGSLLVLYYAFCGTYTMPAGFASVAVQQSAAHNNLGMQVAVKVAAGGERAISLTGVIEAFSGGTCACIEEWTGAANVITNVQSVNTHSTVLLASVPATSVVIAAQSTYQPSGPTGTTTGITEYCHIPSIGGGGSLDIHEMPATVATAYTFTSTGGSNPDTNGAYILFAIDAASSSVASSAVAAVGATYPASPSLGQLCYRTDLAHLYVWDGSVWQQA